MTAWLEPANGALVAVVALLGPLVALWRRLLKPMLALAGKVGDAARDAAVAAAAADDAGLG